MGTGYTIGGDSYLPQAPRLLCGQTFRVQAQTSLKYIRVYLKKPSTAALIDIGIYYADGNHEPYLPRLAVASISHTDFPPGVEEAWIQKTLSRSVPAIPPEYFALVITEISPPWEHTPQWRYDLADATYPYGLRISTPDPSFGWDKHFNDDHSFFIWGTPPAPPVDPGPQLGKWFPLAIAQEEVPGGFDIILTSDAPAHLYCCYTFNKPVNHKAQKKERGVFVPCRAIWENVYWTPIRQQEEGDTLSHTFAITGLAPDTELWLFFLGKVGDLPCSSQSCVFYKYYAGIIPPAALIIEPWSWWGNPQPTLVYLVGEPWTS